MSYENKEYILQFFEGVHEEENRAELIEVYRKAKAWDKLSESIRECNKEIEVKDGLNALFRTSKKGQIVQRHIDCFESGEPYAKK